MISALLIGFSHSDADNRSSSSFRYAQAEIQPGASAQTLFLRAGSPCHATARIGRRGKVMYRYFLACITCSRLESPLCGYDDLRFIFKACLIHSRQLRSFQNQLLVFTDRARASLIFPFVSHSLLVSSKISTFSKLLIRLSFLFLFVNFRSQRYENGRGITPVAQCLASSALHAVITKIFVYRM